MRTIGRTHRSPDWCLIAAILAGLACGVGTKAFSGDLAEGFEGPEPSWIVPSGAGAVVVRERTTNRPIGEADASASCSRPARANP